MSAPRGRLLLALAAAGVAVAACGQLVSSRAPAVTGATTSVSIITQHSAIGIVLATSSGRTIYLQTSDKKARPTCTGTCLGVWPPVLVTAVPRRPAGVSASFATVRTAAGRQLTVDGHPAYTYVGDSGPQQVNGEGIVSFGATWYAFATDGQPITRTG
ncbi:MAG: COG4315 family predicted lipoprotein [Mycobacteriales bacterium]